MRKLNELPNGGHHVPHLYDFILTDSTDCANTKAFIVMEYFEYDLKTLIGRHIHYLEPK